MLRTTQTSACIGQGGTPLHLYHAKGVNVCLRIDFGAEEHSSSELLPLLGVSPGYLISLLLLLPSYH